MASMRCIGCKLEFTLSAVLISTLIYSRTRNVFLVEKYVEAWQSARNISLQNIAIFLIRYVRFL